jgi:hypothetical protein
VRFHLQYTLTRRQRFAVEFTPWLPCLAASLGFTVAMTYLAAVVSGWFLLLFFLPLIVARGFLGFLWRIASHAGWPVDLLVEEERLGVLVEGERRWIALDGVFQVFRSQDGSIWTVLHLNGSQITIPTKAIQPEQLDYLKGFAIRARAQRKLSNSTHSTP